MYATPLFTACLLLLMLAGCAMNDSHRPPPQAQPAEAPGTDRHGPAPVAPLQRQPAPARIPYQLILPPRLPAPLPPVAPPVAPPASVGPHPPQPLTTCDPGGCWNAGGSRYDGGIGNSFLDRNGRLCQRNGTWMQCF